MENKKNGLIIALVIIIAILCLIIGWLLGSKFSDKENEVLNNSNNAEEKEESKDTEKKDLKQVISCTGTSSHQYGELTEVKKYIFKDNIFTGLEAVVKYDFGTEDLAKNMINKTLITPCANETVECTSTQESQYVVINIKIDENNLNNIVDLQKYKTLTVNEVLNKSIEDNHFFNNQSMTCVEE